MRKGISKIILAIGIVAALFPWITPTQAAGWLSGWSYRKPITITETSGISLTDYQVLLTVNTQSLISGNKLQSGCQDVRFTLDDGLTTIPYWIESGCGTTSTKIWVKVPSIPASSAKTIYMYYGNPSASSASNGSVTFEFFDDFEGASLDTGKWTKQNSAGGSLSIANSQVQFSLSGSSDYIWIHSNNAFTYPIWVEGKMDSFNCSGATLRLGQSTGTTLRPNGNYYNEYSADAYDGSYRIVGDDATLGWTVISTSCGDTSGIWSFVWSATGSQKFNVNYASKLTGSHSTNPIGNYYLYLGLAQWVGGNAKVDWARARKYASPEPTTSVGGEELPTPTPTPPPTPTSIPTPVPARGARSIPDLPTWALILSGVAAFGLYTALSRLRGPHEG